MKRIVRVFAIVVMLLLALALSLPFLIDANHFRPMLASRLSAALSREVKLGNLKLAILSGGVTADEISVSDDPAFSPAPFLRAKSLKVGVELLPLLFSRKLNVTALTIDRPEVVLLQTASAKWNFSSLGAKSSAAAQPVPEKAGLDLSAKLVKISNGRFSLGKAHSNAQPLVLDPVNLELRNFSASGVFPFSLSAKLAGGGDIQLEGKAGPLHAADAAMTPVEASLAVSHLDLAASGLVDRATGIAGLVSIDGSARSNGRTAEIKGRLKAEKLKLAKGGSPAARPVELDCAVEHDLLKQSGVLSRSAIHIGAAAATLAGTYNLRGQSPVVNMKLDGPNMPVRELAAMLPALDIVLPAGSSIQSGAASVQLTTEGPVDRLVSTGSVKLENARLAGFDLGSKMAAVERLAGIQSGPNTDIQLLSAGVKAAPEGTRVEDIQLVAPAIGELTGAGSISPAHALDFRMRVTLHTSGAVMAALGQKGDTSVPFLIQGTSSNPSFKPDVKAIASEKLQRATGGDAAKAASGILDSLLGRKKQK